MQIKADENNYTFLEFSDAERDVFAYTLPFMHGNYDELEFSFREFSKNDLQSLQAQISTASSLTLSLSEVRVLGSVLAYIVNYLEDFFEDIDPTRLSEAHLDASLEMYKALVEHLIAQKPTTSTKT